MRSAQRKRLSPLYVLIPVLYTAVIFALVYVQFSGTERFSVSSGQLTASGVRGNAGFERLRVGWDDLAVLFSTDRPLNLVAAGATTAISVIDYEVRGDTIRLNFEGQVTLDVAGDRGRADWSLSLPDAATADRAILPLDTTGSLEPLWRTPLAVVAGPSGPTVVEGVEGTSFLLAPPALSLQLAGANGSFRFERGRGSDSPRLAWLQRAAALSAPDAAGAGGPPTVAEYERTVAEAWLSRRQLPLPATEMAAAATALGLAASAAADDGGGPLRALTGEVAAAYAQLQRQRALAHTPGALIPFLGLVGDYPSASLAADASRLMELQNRIGNGDPAVFAEHDLVRFIVNRGPRTLVEELLRLALLTEPLAIEGDDAASRDAVATAVGAAATLLDLHRFVPLSQFGDQQTLSRDVLARATEWVNTTILPAVTVAGPQFVLDVDGVDLLLQLRAATLLSHSTFTDTHRTVGEKLLRSALDFVQGDGSLPVTPDRQGSRVASAELVLSILDRTPHLPREVPLFRQLGEPNLWALTAAQVDASATAESWVLRFAYPVGHSHYVAVVGVPNFIELRMHQLRWKTDPEYRRYSDGWAYDAEQKMLLIKLTQRTDADVVELLFRR